MLGAACSALLLRASRRASGLGGLLQRNAGAGAAALHGSAGANAADPEPVALAKLKDSFNDATSVTYLEELEKRYHDDPASVDRTWASFFRSLGERAGSEEGREQGEQREAAAEQSRAAGRGAERPHGGRAPPCGRGWGGSLCGRLRLGGASLSLPLEKKQPWRRGGGAAVDRPSSASAPQQPLPLPPSHWTPARHIAQQRSQPAAPPPHRQNTKQKTTNTTTTPLRLGRPRRRDRRGLRPLRARRVGRLALGRRRDLQPDDPGVDAPGHDGARVPGQRPLCRQAGPARARGAAAQPGARPGELRLQRGRHGPRVSVGDACWGVVGVCSCVIVSVWCTVCCRVLLCVVVCVVVVCVVGCCVLLCVVVCTVQCVVCCCTVCVSVLLCAVLRWFSRCICLVQHQQPSPSNKKTPTKHQQNQKGSTSARGRAPPASWPRTGRSARCARP